MNAANELLPTRQSLLSRLRDCADQESWRVFFDSYWRLIYNAAIKAGLTDAEAQDAVQETLISVMKSMPNFQYDAKKGSFKGWLLHLTRWRISDQFRKRQRGLEHLAGNSRRPDETATVERVPNPDGPELEALWDEEWERNLVGAAIESVKRKVDPKQYQLFDLYVLKKWTVSKVAQTLSVNPGRVYLTKHRINRLIKKEIDYLRAKMA
ncbi:MAG TPA: sigma-70 family RNA polymerase sigma factor [Verrucomicrobiae bacterium]|jgi:RNA polymerase sigma-70 factor (ECF subfamily)|nr:sigma-70 family RNA polymerase sigma factor [Verrucomicrobiae bacterium]